MSAACIKHLTNQLSVLFIHPAEKGNKLSAFAISCHKANTVRDSQTRIFHSPFEQSTANRYCCEHKPIYNDEVLCQSSKSVFLDQVLSRFKFARDEARHSVCCFFAVPTLLTSPDSAGGGLGRDRVIPRRGVTFSFFNIISAWTSQVYTRLCRKTSV